MQKCNFCGTNLPENTRFCGMCGSMQAAHSAYAATIRSYSPQPQSWVPENRTLAATWSPYSKYPSQGSAPAWYSNGQALTTPLPTLVAENKDEQRRGIAPWSPLYGAALTEGALLSSGRVSSPGAPVVQGTPQIGSVPGVAGSPTSYTNGSLSQSAPNTPVSSPTQGAGNAAPVSHPVQGMPVNHPAPVNHPVQGPATMPVQHPAPVSHPVQGSQPIHYPPVPPGTHKHHPPHEPHRHHNHPTQHQPHRLVKTHVAGGSSVKTIIVVVAAVVVVAAGGIAAAAHFFSHPATVIHLASVYQGPAHNVTYNVGGSLSLSSITEDQQGNISGMVTWGSPLVGDGPFTGTVSANSSVTFTDVTTNDSGTTITFTGTIHSDGSISGNYSSEGPGGPQQGTYTVSPSS